MGLQKAVNLLKDAVFMEKKTSDRKKAERPGAPEELNDYVRVLNPSVWLILACVLMLLAGAFVWGIFGRIDSTVTAQVLITDGEAVCYTTGEDVKSVSVGMTVKYSDVETVITGIGPKAASGYSYILSKAEGVPDGVYEAKIVTSSRKPISFIFN